MGALYMVGVLEVKLLGLLVEGVPALDEYHPRRVPSLAGGQSLEAPCRPAELLFYKISYHCSIGIL